MNRATHRLTLAIGLTASTIMFAPPFVGWGSGSGREGLVEQKGGRTTTSKTTAAKEALKLPPLDEAHVAAVLKEARVETPPEDSSKDSAAKKDSDTPPVLTKKQALTPPRKSRANAAIKKDSDAPSP